MIRGYLFGDKAAVERIRGARQDAPETIRTTVQRLTLRLQAKVKSDKLSGQVLNVRSGRLRRSINARVDGDGWQVTGVVGTNVEYARAHEFGFKGTVQVKEHLRRMRQGNVMVSQHTRNVNIPERSFLRSALDDMKPEIRAAFLGALRTLVR